MTAETTPSHFAPRATEVKIVSNTAFCHTVRYPNRRATSSNSSTSNPIGFPFLSRDSNGAYGMSLPMVSVPATTVFSFTVGVGLSVAFVFDFAQALVASARTTRTTAMRLPVAFIRLPPVQSSPRYAFRTRSFPSKAGALSCNTISPDSRTYPRCAACRAKSGVERGCGRQRTSVDATLAFCDTAEEIVPRPSTSLAGLPRLTLGA